MMIGCQFIYLFLVFGLATTLKPLIDKSEIGEREEFTVTCDTSRVIDRPNKWGPLFSLSILRKFLNSTGSDFELIMKSSSYGFRPKHVIWPWKPIFHFYNVSKPEDQYIILHNTNASCDDAGEYRCYIYAESDSFGYRDALLGKKASCFEKTTETSPQPAETAYSRINGTDPSAHTEPSTQSSGTQAVKCSGKSIFIAEAIVLIVVIMSGI